MRKFRLKIFFCASLLFAILAGCSSASEDTKNEKLKIVCTTGMIGDALQNIVGDRAEVISLMGSGVDPHLYKATQGDLGKLTSADIIFYNGLHLEGKMGEVLEQLGRQKKVVAIADGLPPEELLQTADFADAYDPHIWFDVKKWKKAIAFATTQLTAFDPKNAAFYAENLRKYTLKLIELDKFVRQEIQKIPEEQRIMITAHDAFGYFGKAYGIEVKGLQGISTVSEFGLRDRVELVNFIVSQNIRAVFVESSVPQKALASVVEGCTQKGHKVKIGGTLFSDAMGEKDTPEGTYLGMVRANVKTIVEGLRGQEIDQST